MTEPTANSIPEMLERAGFELCVMDSLPNGHCQKLCGSCEQIARQVIEAMREPTDAMRLAMVGGWNSLYPDRMDKLSEHQQSESTKAAWGRAFAAGVDAALK